MIFRHKGLEIGGGDMVWTTLAGAPLDKKTVGDAAEHAQNPDAIITLHAAPVTVVGDVQTLMQAAFDAPTFPVEQQEVPFVLWQPVALIVFCRAREECDAFFLTMFPPGLGSLITPDGKRRQDKLCSISRALYQDLLNKCRLTIIILQNRLRDAKFSRR
jgi:hypothetical protein